MIYIFNLSNSISASISETICVNQLFILLEFYEYLKDLQLNNFVKCFNFSNNNSNLYFHSSLFLSELFPHCFMFFKFFLLQND